MSFFVHGQARFDSSLIRYAKDVMVGAERKSQYIEILKGKHVALVVNPSSEVYGEHLVDYLLANHILIDKVFAPEHGFRGIADAGELITDGLDSKTGIEIKSLYGKNKKPLPEDLLGIDIVVFDIQDVGVRFYTYITTMHNVMLSCAQNGVEFMVLDRPNPNGFYVTGPLLEKEQASFVGTHAIPIVHGMTVGELAQMINEENWLGNGYKCKLTVIPTSGWTHKDLYQLPVKPSPNLPNMTAVYLYPTLGLFEGTNVSAGRGTVFPFQVFGSPFIRERSFSFTPEPNQGAKYPKYKGRKCYGKDLKDFDIASFYAHPEIDLELLVWAYGQTDIKSNFFLKNNFFDLLSGNQVLKKTSLMGLLLRLLGRVGHLN